MERAVQLAMRDALDLARSRGARLVRITLHGGEGADSIARIFLDALGLAEVELALEPTEGAVRLGAVEMLPRAPTLTPPGGSAQDKS